MHPRTAFFILVGLNILLASCASAPQRGRSASSSEEFEGVMNALARAWNAGDARRAADCFTELAVYTEPPDKQIYRGRDALYRFFGGEQGRAGQMTMQWHHLAFN